MSPGEVLAKHSSLDLTRWFAYFKLEAADERQRSEKRRLQGQVARQRGRRPRRR